MLDIQITIKGDKIILEGLNQISKEIPDAIERGLVRSALGIYEAAFNFLHGPGRTPVRLRETTRFFMEEGREGTVSAYGITKRKTKARGQFYSLQARPGSYPVPQIKGNLIRLLNWLHPGTSKTGEAGTFSAGPLEVNIYDSAIYADVVHEGKGTSKKYGPRRYLTDALTMFNQGNNIKETIEEEIQKTIDDSGMGQSSSK